MLTCPPLRSATIDETGPMPSCGESPPPPPPSSWLTPRTQRPTAASWRRSDESPPKMTVVGWSYASLVLDATAFAYLAQHEYE